MSINNYADVGRFHTKFGLPTTLSYEAGPKEVSEELREFRGKFLIEELQEYFEAHGYDLQWELVARYGDDQLVPKNIDHAQAFDSLIDLVYIAMGTAHLEGYPWHEGWNRVQYANMAKVRAAEDGSDSKRGSSFDVVKPPGWTPPDIEGLLEGYGWVVNW